MPSTYTWLFKNKYQTINHFCIMERGNLSFSQSSVGLDLKHLRMEILYFQVISKLTSDIIEMFNI